MHLDESEAVISVRFGELWLRGRNRGSYIKLLLRNLSERLGGENVALVREYDRVLLKLNKGSDINSIKSKLATVFGISRFETAYVTKPELGAIKKLASNIISDFSKGSTLRIQSHRSYKELDFDSIKIISEVAGAAKKKGFNISNRNFDNEININVTKDSAFIGTRSIKGAGGLPTGSSGRAVILLSGGIDSPVAAWYAMKRGMRPIYLHFHGFPGNDATELSKIIGIADKLREYSMHYKLYLMPTHIFQLAALQSRRNETVLLKYFMLHVAEKVAEKEDASLIFTGDCLGQVASQTPLNLLSEGQGIKHPILRPLIGFDKEEIIKTARQIGTYELSIAKYMDVCSINVRNPSTGVQPDKILQLAKECKIKSVISKTLKLGSTTER